MKIRSLDARVHECFVEILEAKVEGRALLFDRLNKKIGAGTGSHELDNRLADGKAESYTYRSFGHLLVLVCNEEFLAQDGKLCFSHSYPCIFHPHLDDIGDFELTNGRGLIVFMDLHRILIGFVFNLDADASAAGEFYGVA